MAPNTVTLDGQELADIKQRLREGKDATLNKALAVLTAEADGWLGQGPWSVTSKPRPAPSGDKHDYVSQAPYYWPDPTKADGLPYVQRDGEKNPEVLTYTDRVYVEKVFRASTALALAWYYMGKAVYAEHAARILRTWFVDKATAMNPNLNHAQLIPGINTGRAIGIIDFSQAYASVLDAVAILGSGDESGASAPGWTETDGAGFRCWNRDFLQWLVHGEFGKTEHAERNNHGSFAAMLVASIAAYVGDVEQARAEARHIRAHLAATLAPDGSQPAELARTRSWHYSTFNLLALTRLAIVADRVEASSENENETNGTANEGKKGDRVWDHVFKAIEYILPAATEGPSQWKYPDLKFQRFAAADIVRAAARAGHAPSQSAVDKLEMPPEGDLWPLRPAPEQLDPVKADV